MQILPALQKVFHKKPMIIYKRNKNHDELIRGNTLQGGKVFKTHFQTIKGELKSCNTTTKLYFYCTQAVSTKNFESYQTKRTFKILHKLNCKSSFLTYLMECTLFKIQYVGKAEITFNI